MRAYVAAPRDGPAKRGGVVVIHENRGLNAHIEDVTRRVALAGFTAVGVDMLSPQGGTPPDEDKAREMFGKVDLDGGGRATSSASSTGSRRVPTPTARSARSASAGAAAW